MKFFNVTAFFYDLITYHDIWREQIARMVDCADIRKERPRVLDLGCGPGVSAFEIARRLGPGASVVGVDAAERMIHRARAHHRRTAPDLTNLEFLVADAEALPFPDGCFDMVFGHSFLYLTRNRDAVLKEARRVTAPGGTLILMEPRRDGSLLRDLPSAVRSAPRHVRHPWAGARFAVSMVAWRGVSAFEGRFTAEALESLIRGSGYDEVQCRPTLGTLGLHAVGRVRP